MSGWIHPKTIATLRPLQRRDTFAWISKHIRGPNRKPFNPHDFPWTKGICGAWDNPEVRIVALQFAARLGKTFIATAMMISSLEHDPATGMIGTPTEQLTKENVRDKYYPMMEWCTQTRKLIPPAFERNSIRIDMQNCRVYGAWSKSPTTLADKDPRYGHGAEIDKWVKSVSQAAEADSFELFMERGIEIPDRKFVIESTPTIKGRSRIERYVQDGWDARFVVPCPRCGEFIELIEGIETSGSAGGILFDKEPDGKANVALAAKTARYRCQLCLQDWGDESRRWVIQKGVWRPSGMSVDRDGNLSGEMNGDPTIAGFQLSRTYAPTFTFSRIAAEIASCLKNDSKWQNTFNSWFGRTYEPRTAIREWDEVGQRLKGSHSVGEVPEWVLFLTDGIDVQEDGWVWTVYGWGRGCRGALIDYGMAYNVNEILAYRESSYRHLDGGPPLRIQHGLMDSGEGRRQDEVFEICRRLNKERGPWLWPSKGSSGSLQRGSPYIQQEFEQMAARAGKRSKSSKKWQGVRGFYHITVSTPFFQAWINNALHYRLPEQDRSLTLPIEATTDEDFLRQMVNERREDSTTATGHTSGRWVVVDENHPWDFRDATRYARCAAEVYTRGRWDRLPLTRRTVSKNPESKINETAAQKSPAIRIATPRIIGRE